MSVTLAPDSNLHSQISLQEGNLTVPQFSFLILLITLGAVAADQFATPALYSSSPLWAVAACAILVWRRGVAGFERETWAANARFSFVRVGLFALGHVLLVLAVRLVHSPAVPSAPTVSAAGWVVAALKMSVLLPTLVLAPFSRWRILAHTFFAEGIAALVVLFTFFPGRVLVAIWPWYGKLLGRFVFFVSKLFVPGLIYQSGFTPSLLGPDLDVTILFACSGISGIALFDYLFAFVAILDWNRLRKGRTLIAYFLGIAAMFLGNALRIAALVVFGNRGFTN